MTGQRDDTEVEVLAELSWLDVFPGRADVGQTQDYLVLPKVEPGVQFFVGRNGSGKSRAARALASKTKGRYISTDRLTGVMEFTTSTAGTFGLPFKGVSLADDFDQHYNSLARAYSGGEAQLSVRALHEQPDVALRVTAFLRRALGRSINLRETAGFIDPFVRMGSTEYSLFRDEGHGLRELVLLLVEIYRSDWNLLVVDEPELHLHPAMARLWLTELSRECAKTDRRAVVVTHEPSLLRPKTSRDLDAIWVFRPGERPSRFGSAVHSGNHAKVTASLSQNPTLVSLLAFAPRPVLVEGPTDVAALSAALDRLCPPEVVAQTDLIECGGSGKVAMWHGISRRIGLDVRAIADLDALFSSDVQHEMDDNPAVTRAYKDTFFAKDPRTSTVIREVVDAARSAGHVADPRGRALWLAAAEDTVETRKGAQVRQIWQDIGLWLHPQGTLEDVLGIERKDANQARMAAEVPGDLDQAATWCAYDLDPSGELEMLLESAVEGIAQGLQQAQRMDPEAVFTSPVGSRPAAALLVDVTPIGKGRYKLTVKRPLDFAGHFLEFDRSTAPSDMMLTAAPRLDADGRSASAT